jgi:hypothetical protein
MIIRLVFLGAALVTGSAVGAAETPQGATGHWEGKLQMPNRELGMAVDLERDPKGVWIGSMSLAGTSAKDVPLRSLKVAATAVRFTADLPDSAVFEGSLSEDENSLSGKASNALGAVPFELTRQGAANVSVPAPNSVLSKKFVGVWEGTLMAGGKELRIRLKLAPATDGLATAVLTSVDQGNTEIPVTSVTIQGQQLQVEARAVSGMYRGTLGAGGEIVGEWSQGSERLALTLKRTLDEK